MRKEKILKRLEKLERCFTPEEFYRVLRHHGATGEWPTDVPRGAVESARKLPRSETGVAPSINGHLLCERCLDDGQLIVANQPGEGSYNLCKPCAAAQTRRLSKCPPLNPRKSTN